MPTKKTSPIKAPDPETQAAGGDRTSSETQPRSLSREDQIRMAAYLAAERRGFAPGYELEDWVAAEQEVDAATGTSEGAERI